MISQTLLALVGFQDAGAAALLNRAEASVTKQSQFKVAISVSVQTGKKVETTIYDVAISRGTVPAIVLQIREPARASKLATNRSFSVSGTKLISYDASADEYLERTVSANGSLLDRLAAVTGPLDPSIGLATDPASLSKFNRILKTNHDWKVSGSTMSRKAANQFTKITFDPATGLIQSLDFGGIGTITMCRFRYSKLTAPPRLVIPGSARKVNAFFEAPTPPKYESPVAQGIADRMARAYRRLTAGQIEITSENERILIAFGNGRFRESRKGFEWSYDGTTFTGWNKEKGAAYRGKLGRTRILPAVIALGGTVDPVTRQLLQKTPPYADIFPANTTVKFGGAVEMGGKKSNILKCDIGPLRLTMLIRSDINLLESLTSDTLDDRKSVVFSTTRRFEYKKLVQAPSPTELSLNLPSGMSPKELPAIRD